MLQDGIFQCPVCGNPITQAEQEVYGRCVFCEQELELEIERMDDEGGPPSGGLDNY